MDEFLRQKLAREMTHQQPIQSERPLADWLDSLNTMQKIGLLPVPVVSDAAGLLGDIQMYREQPETRGLLNYGMSALGLLPFMPGAFGMVKPGSWWTNPKVPSAEKLGRNSAKFLHHSSIADPADIASGIKPTAGGQWVREVLEGSTDMDVDELLERATPLSWWSEDPTWVRMIVARKLGKYVGDVTDDEMLQHGHLALVARKTPELNGPQESMVKVGETGLDYGPYSEVSDLSGRKIKAYEAGLFDDGMEPFGVERNEWVATKAIEPLFQLTGQDLLDYLRAAGYPRGSTW